MKLIPLPVETQARTGKTHKLVITAKDINGTSSTLAGQTQTFSSAWTSGTAQAVIPPNALGASSLTLPAGTQVLGTALVNVVTPFTGGSVSAMTLSLGDGGSATRFVNAVDVFTAAGYLAGAVANYNYVSADTIDAKFTATGDTLANVTAGEVEIYLAILPVCDLSVVK